MFLLVLIAPLQLNAAEYFVTKQGNDANGGLTKETSFLTVQKGVDALQPGDTLTILPGEYCESVFREGLGTNDTVTTIRADLPGTVLLRGDRPAPEFKKADGFRFVYSARFDQPVVQVLEIDTLTILQRQVEVFAVEFAPGSFYYDNQTRTLFISTSDMQPPDKHVCTVGIFDRSGLLLKKPRCVMVEGLAATGFFPSEEKRARFSSYVSGIMMLQPSDCAVRECTAYLNGNGICLVSGVSNVIEKCLAYVNFSPFHSSAADCGNFMCYDSNQEVIRNSTAYGSPGISFGFYGTMPGPVFLEGNTAWGNGVDDFRIKGTGPAMDRSLARNNVGATSGWSVKRVQNNTLGGRNAFCKEMSPDNVYLAGLNRDREFADPLNMDYRLQSDSSLRGKKPGDADRGAFPYATNIFYLKPGGDDASDGLSARGAWKTLDRAVRDLKAGDTLYFLAGTCQSPTNALRLQGKEGKPVRLRGRGLDRVILSGGLNMEHWSHVEFERLNFAGSVNIEGGEKISFSQCRFAGKESGILAQNTSKLRITHCEFAFFTKAAVSIKGASGAFVAGNIFDNKNGPAIEISSAENMAYCDYNAFRNMAASGTAGHDIHSFQAKAEITQADGAFAIGNPGSCAARGPLGKPAGTFPLMPEREVRLAGPFVLSLTDTTANLQWWNSFPCTCEIAWGDTPECVQTNSARSPGSGSFSLTDLEPGKEYYFQVRRAKQNPQPAYARSLSTDFSQPPLSFVTTQKTSSPKTLYVTSNGNDAADGLSRQTAWRTLHRAAREAMAGDTVLVGAGEYHGMVWIQGTGDTGKPVTWRAAPGEKVVINGMDRQVSRGFFVNGKKNIVFDGFYFSNIGLGEGMDGPLPTGAFVLTGCDGIRITRCFMDGRGGYSPALASGRRCKNVLLKNCVITCCFQGLQVYQFDGFTLENNVFLINMIAAAIIGNLPKQKIFFRKSVVTDSAPIKKKVQLFEIPHVDSIQQENNCFFLRAPPDQRENLAFFHQSAGNLKLSEWFQLKGANGSLAGNPGFAAMPSVPTNAATNAFIPDLLPKKKDLDFPDLFATDPKVVEKGIGLEPEAFNDFHFNQTNRNQKATENKGAK
ncbi:MAG: right-handed parallel beta-helix repeat-containing protein [Kiritimatiellia bacterium]